MATQMMSRSLNRRATQGNNTRVVVAAKANRPKTVPIPDALTPRSCPKIGTMKVWTSQHEDKNQLTQSKRRKGACLSNCQADSA